MGHWGYLLLVPTTHIACYVDGNSEMLVGAKLVVCIHIYGVKVRHVKSICFKSIPNGPI